MIPGNEGDRTGVPCPRCDGEIIYNGNYFCENWVSRSPIDRTECDWAMSEAKEDENGEPTFAADLVVWNQLKRRYKPLRDYLRREGKALPPDRFTVRSGSSVYMCGHGSYDVRQVGRPGIVVDITADPIQAHRLENLLNGRDFKDGEEERFNV